MLSETGTLHGFEVRAFQCHQWFSKSLAEPGRCFAARASDGMPTGGETVPGSLE